jgi:hypothetical protein
MEQLRDGTVKARQGFGANELPLRIEHRDATGSRVPTEDRIDCRRAEETDLLELTWSFSPSTHRLPVGPVRLEDPQLATLSIRNPDATRLVQVYPLDPVELLGA